MPARILYANRALTALVVTASSEQSSFPRRFLQDENRGWMWRSKVGWNPHALLSDQLTFLDNGVARTAQLTAGNYPTGAIYAAHVTTQMNAVAVTNTYLCSYDSGAAKYTLARATGAGTFGLPFATGAAVTAGRSAHIDLGYASTDLTGATTYTAGSVARKSREFVTIDLGGVPPAVTVGMVIEHNLGASGTITQQGHTADTAAGWAAPDVSDALAGDAVLRMVYRASATKRYWRLLINDVSTNAAGYTEIGLWSLGEYVEPSIGYSVEFVKSYEPLSAIADATSGATQRDERPDRTVYSMSWLELPAAVRAVISAWSAAAPPGKPFFLAFDPTNAPTDVAYGFWRRRPPEQMSGNLYWSFPLVFEVQLP